MPSLALALLALMLRPELAAACSPIPSCPSVTVTLPPDGALDVPRNVELEAYVSYPRRVASSLELRVADTGQHVALAPSPLPGRMRPVELLEAGVRYELLGPRNLRAFVGDSTTCDEALHVLATFVVGDHIDTVAPTDVRASGGGCVVRTCGSTSCCGPYVAAISGGTWSATDDGGLPVAYAMGSPTGPRTFDTRGSVAMTNGGAPLHGAPSIVGSPVFAIDAAGNVSSPSPTFEMSFSCYPSTPEEWAMYDLRCDGGPCPPPPRSGGCAVARARTPGELAWLVLALSIGGLRARRAVTRRVGVSPLP